MSITGQDLLGGPPPTYLPSEPGDTPIVSALSA